MLAVQGMTEDEVAEQIREAWATASYAKANCPKKEFEAVFKELLRITQWQRKRKAS